MNDTLHGLARIPLNIASWLWTAFVWQHGWNWIGVPVLGWHFLSYKEAVAIYALAGMFCGLLLIALLKLEDERDQSEKWITAISIPFGWSAVLLELWIIHAFVLN